jgi:hypothetical protein
LENQDTRTIILNKFDECADESRTVSISLKKGNGQFFMKLSKDGIMVSNLGKQPMLPWAVFTETVLLVKKNGGRAIKGDAMKGKLGDSKLPIDSVEGNIAFRVYDQKLGESVFRRITPVCNILEWAGICIDERGELLINPAHATQK